MSNVAGLIETTLHSDSEGQHLTLPPELRLDVDKVYIGRDPATGDLVITQKAPRPRRSMQEVLADIAEDPFPEEFMRDREQGIEARREPLL